MDQLHPDDSGLQSKDLINATDEMTQDLLALSALNDSRAQWTIVATGMENESGNRRESYDIFISRLKTQVTRQGHGRVSLIENRDRFHTLQSRELEPEARDFNPGRAAPGPAGVQPQFALNGTVQEMPNRATSLFRFEFRLTDLRTRQVVWTNEYLVKVER